MNYRHSHATGKRSPTYISWMNAVQRVTNPNATSWPRYGALGIRMCERWRTSFANFLADMGERPEGKWIDRIDPRGDYEPGNCRWATPSEQRRNQRRYT